MSLAAVGAGKRPADRGGVAVVPLNDNAAVPVMLDLHRFLRGGQTLAESIHSVRRALTDDPIQQATAVSLLVLGAA